MAHTAAPVAPRGRARPEPRSALAVEALGYVGGIVLVIGALLIGQLYWSDLPLAVRLLLVAGAAVLLATAGALVPQDEDAGRRLRGVLWTGSCAAVAGFLAVLGDGGLDWPNDRVALLASAGATTCAAGLWSRHRGFLLQAATAGGLMATSALVVVTTTDTQRLPSTAAWVVALGWLALAQTDRIAAPRLASYAASAAAILLSATVLDAVWGTFLSLGTLALVLGLGIARSDLGLLVIGALGLMTVLPALVTIWFPDSSALPFVLFGTGLVLVLIATWEVRRRTKGVRRR